jgi:Asp-tRNA(Asn)/Glu-tRNA(Gln) amidotransferase C subunit
MNKVMTVDVLSSIKGAKPSETINKLFEVINQADLSTINAAGSSNKNAVALDSLREDNVVESSNLEKQLIVENFPQEKNGYLVVAKVIEA